MRAFGRNQSLPEPGNRLPHGISFNPWSDRSGCLWICCFRFFQLLRIDQVLCSAACFFCSYQIFF